MSGNTRRSKILVAMSGGVDSSVAALLLLEAGHDVVGATMCFGRSSGKEARPLCCGADAVKDARAVCDRLGIAHHVFDYSRAMREQVIARFVAGQRAGLTPNPCVDCNRLLKFGSLLERARVLGFDALATGHYAGVGERHGLPVLTRARDRRKDQSYFLYGIGRDDLSRVRFPLEALSKEEVRALARKAGLPVARKAESQDLCFAGTAGYAGLLAEEGVPCEPGPIVDEEGRIIGRHRGLPRYTVGQREGLGVGGGRPLYVLARDQGSNRLVVGPREGLSVRALTARDVNVLVEPIPAALTARIRHRGREAACGASLRAGRLEVRFLERVEAAAPGQAVVLYEGEVVVGGGTIESAREAGEPLTEVAGTSTFLRPS